MKGFKQFIMRGNVVDLAVAVVIGAAFGAVIASFVKNLLTPILSIPGKTDFSSLTFTVHGSVFRYGTFINDLLAFLIIAAAIYFAVVMPLNRLAERRAAKAEATTKNCTECLTEIPIEARKCAACASPQEISPAS